MIFINIFASYKYIMIIIRNILDLILILGILRVAG